MSGIVNFNAQVAPMEHVEKVVRQEQEHGQIKQQAMLQRAGQSLSEDSKEVQRTSDSGKGDRVKRRTSGDGAEGGAAFYSGEFAKKQNADSGLAEQESAAQDNAEASGAVWSGNIVNIKV